MEPASGALIEPGFVNGKDAHIEMLLNDLELPNSSSPVPLTNEPRPYLLLDGWRNPLLPGGVSASLDGEIIAAPGEGYPPFAQTPVVRSILLQARLGALADCRLRSN
jgi:hypothetical protein